MNDSENFEQLRRLLALKRYEQPPPGYFDRLSREVIARIKAGEPGESAGAMNWLSRFRAAFETKPLLAGAFGTAVCALLVSGISYSEKLETPPVAALPTPGELAFAAENSPPAPLNQSMEHSGITIASSTTPIMSPANPFFSQFGNGIGIQPVSLNLGGN